MLTLTQAIIDEYLRTTEVRKLHLGSGGRRKDGWLNTDVRPGPGEVDLDASKPFPLPSGSVHYVYGENLVEHLSFDDGLSMLQECVRVLAGGGRARFATPSLDQVVSVLRDPPTPEASAYVAGKARWHQYPRTADPACYLVNHQMRAFGHQFLYTPSMLRARMEEAGLVDVEELAVGESRDPELRDLESRAKWKGGERVDLLNDYETFVLEGRKP